MTIRQLFFLSFKVDDKQHGNDNTYTEFVDKNSQLMSNFF